MTEKRRQPMKKEPERRNMRKVKNKWRWENCFPYGVFTWSNFFLQNLLVSNTNLPVCHLLLNLPDRIYMLYYLKLAVAWHPTANISCILKTRTSSPLYMYHTEMQDNQSQQQRSAKEVFNVQEMWHSPKTFPTVIHGLALCFITWHLHWDSSPHLPTRDWTPVNCHQYPEFLLCC